jgi:hypothetical protein
MRERFEVRLGAVFIDTVKACFDMQDENSNAEVGRICNIIRYIGEALGVVVIPIHHYGKDAGTGLRGGSAWQGAADIVISVTADIDPVTGKISNRELALAKARDGDQGPLAPFMLEWVKLGTDEDGEEFGSSIVKIDIERTPSARSTLPKGIRIFDDACKIALGIYSEDVQLRKNGPSIRAVDLKHAKAKFCEMYVTGEDNPKKAKQTSERAWRRVLAKIPDEYATAKGPDGREWLFLKTPTGA